jgi:hypothetical protein
MEKAFGFMFGDSGARFTGPIFVGVDGSCRFVIVMDVGRWCCRKGNV